MITNESSPVSYTQGMSKAGWQHGTTNGYGNYGCRCDLCREAARVYAADYKRRKQEKALGGVVDFVPRLRRVPTVGSSKLSGAGVGTGHKGPRSGQPAGYDAETSAAQQVSSTPGEPGECEQAVILETNLIGAEELRPAMVSAAISMARILDNKALVALHPTTTRQLTAILQTLNDTGRRKRKGRLASVQQMTQRRATAG